jgi:hypothetical protein
MPPHSFADRHQHRIHTLARCRVTFRLAILPCASSSCATTSRSRPRNAPSLVALGVCYPKYPLSTARPRILRAVLRIAWVRRRCTIMASSPLNDEPAPYLHALRRCACASCNRDCRLPALACYRSYPLVRACSRCRCARSHFILGYVPSFTRQLPSMFRRIHMRPPTHLLGYLFSRTHLVNTGSVNFFFERLSWSPSTRFLCSPPGIIPRRY